jgi:hypothetical protein
VSDKLGVEMLLQDAGGYPMARNPLHSCR